MKRIFKNKFLACIIAAVIALLAAVFAVFYIDKNDNTVEAQAATPVTDVYYQMTDTEFFIGGTYFPGSTLLNIASNYASSELPWYIDSRRNTITTVTFKSVVSPNDVSYWFTNMVSLTTINNLHLLDVSNVTRMGSLFFGCRSLTSLDLSTFNAPSGLEGQNYIGGTTLNSLKHITLSPSLMQYVDTTRLIDDLHRERIDLFREDKVWYGEDNTEYSKSNPMSSAGTYYSMPHTGTWSSCDWETVTSATCATAGTKRCVCAECGGLITQTIPATGQHVGGTATCVYQAICEVCHGPYGELAPHKGGTATCETKAICGECNQEYGDLSPHTPQIDKAVPATCTAGGKTAGSHCFVCNTVLTAQQTTNPLGHIWGNWHTTTPATEEAEGEEQHECQRDGCDEVETQPIPKLDHVHVEVVDEAVDPTCMTEGKTEGKHCLGCGNVLVAQQTIPALDHDWATEWSKDETEHWHACTLGCDTKLDEAAHAYTIWKVDTAATVTSTGVGHHECVCGARGADEEIPKETCSHTNKSHVAAVEATCIAAGNPEYWTCGDCGKNLDGTNTEISTIVTPVDPNNHKAWGAWQPETEATCTDKGSEKRVCDDCHIGEETRETAIAPDAHDIEHHEAKAANCTEAGWNAYDTCTRCDYTTKTEIPATDHTTAVDEAKAPTCTETGLTEGAHCSVCNEVLTAQEEVPALGHSHEWKITKEATTEEAGLMENLCTRCGDKDGEQEIAKLVDSNGEIDLPVDINVEFKVTQSSTDNDYSNIDKGLKRGYWAQLWYRNDDGTLGDEFTDKINCFLTLKIPVEIIEAIRGGEEINRDKIAEGLKVYFVNEAGAPVEVENFEIAMRDDDSWQIKFNYNEKFRAEVVFAADTVEQTPAESKAGIPWWVWLIVGLVAVAIIGIIIIIVVIKKKNGGDGGAVVTAYDDADLKAKLSAQDKKLDEIKEIVDGGFNDMVDE